MKLLPERISVLLLSELLLSFGCFAAAALIIFGASGLTANRLPGLAVAALSVVGGCFFTGLYRNLQWRSRIALILQLCSAFGLALLLEGGFSYTGTGVGVPLRVTLLGACLNFLAMVGWRIAYAAC